MKSQNEATNPSEIFSGNSSDETLSPKSETKKYSKARVTVKSTRGILKKGSGNFYKFTLIKNTKKAHEERNRSMGIATKRHSSINKEALMQLIRSDFEEKEVKQHPELDRHGVKAKMIPQSNSLYSSSNL
jgi:hypothetical protein